MWFVKEIFIYRIKILKTGNYFFNIRVALINMNQVLLLGLSGSVMKPVNI